MTTLAIVVGAVLLCVLAGYVYMVWGGLKEEWRPPELRNARLIMVEKDLFTQAPYPIAGRPDQVFKLRNGRLMPVEYKNRDYFRVHQTDIAEISLQAWLLRRHGKRTAEYGYIAIRHRKTHERRAMPVQLMDDAACEALIQRYLSIIEGTRVAQRCEPPKCKGCGHYRYC